MPADARLDDRWAYDDLAAVIAEARKNGKWSNEITVRVSNRPCRDKLRDLITEVIWPGILKIFEGTGLTPHPLTEDDGQLWMRHEWAGRTVMVFEFCVLDSEIADEEGGEELAPYRCFIEGKVRTRGCMFDTNFEMHFPDSIDLTRLRPLLCSDKFGWRPPELTHEKGYQNLPNRFNVRTNLGRDLDYMFDHPPEVMLAELAEHVTYLRRVIRAVRRLSADFQSDHHVRALAHEVEKCFGGDSWTTALGA